MSKQSVNLTSDELALIKEILSRHFFDAQFFLFGSRGRGDHKKFSDIDILIKCSKTIPTTQFGDTKEDFAKSDLPYTVDLLDWYDTSQDFLKRIEKDLIKI